jgi:hypothetical protein
MTGKPRLAAGLFTPPQDLFWPAGDSTWILGLIHSAVHKTPRSASSAIARSSFALSLSGSCSASRRYLTARGLLIADSETSSVLARSGAFKHLPDPFRALVRKRMFGEPAQCNRDLPQFVPSLAGWQLSGLSQGLRGPF